MDYLRIEPNSGFWQDIDDLYYKKYPKKWENNILYLDYKWAINICHGKTDRHYRLKGKKEKITSEYIKRMGRKIWETNRVYHVREEGDIIGQLKVIRFEPEKIGVNIIFEKVEEVETLKQNRDLEIHYARYGTDAQKDDVIDVVKEQVSPYERLNLLIDNDNLGGDFYPGKEKQLHIIYTFNGILYEEELDEGEVLTIPKLAMEAQRTNSISNDASVILAVLSPVLGISLVLKRL